MARLATLIAALVGAAIAFSIGWILGYVYAPMEDADLAARDDVALRKSLEHVHEGTGSSGYGEPVWTADVAAEPLAEAMSGLRRRGEQV